MLLPHGLKACRVASGERDGGSLGDRPETSGNKDGIQYAPRLPREADPWAGPPEVEGPSSCYKGFPLTSSKALTYMVQGSPPACCEAAWWYPSPVLWGPSRMPKAEKNENRLLGELIDQRSQKAQSSGNTKVKMSLELGTQNSVFLEKCLRRN